MKKVMLIAMSAAMAAAFAVTAFAADNKADSASAPASMPQSVDAEDNLEDPVADPVQSDDSEDFDMPEKLPQFMEYTGKITEVDAENGRITIDSARMGEIVLTVGEETYVIDQQAVAPVALKDLKAGDEIVAYTLPIMTMSLPPITNAQVILTNAPKEGASAHFIEADTVTRNENGALSILSANGDLIVTFNEDAALMPYLTRQAVTLDAFQPGTRFLAYYSEVAESYPAQATASKVVVFADAYAGYVEVDGEDVIVNGTKLVYPALKESVPSSIEGVGDQTYTLIPATKAAQALGLTTRYNKEAKRLTAYQINEEGKMEAYFTVEPGKVQVVGEEGKLEELEDMVVRTNKGLLYVELNFFSRLPQAVKTVVR